MKTYKEGDNVRLKGTFVNATIINNNCNGFYKIKLGDTGFIKMVYYTEITDPTDKVIKGYVKWLLRFRSNIETFIIQNAVRIIFIISIVFLSGCLIALILFTEHVFKHVFINF